jgi:hypothetical protein
MTASLPLIPAKAGTQAFFNHENHEKHESRASGSELRLAPFVFFVVHFLRAALRPCVSKPKNLGPRFRGDERIIGLARR